uniref:Helicase C-terminal domain-containing protein n=1 Tax=Strongyloides venezuelensis TaxID=75913 RepID=A0A0K0EVR0_STRVS
MCSDIIAAENKMANSFVLSSRKILVLVGKKRTSDILAYFFIEKGIKAIPINGEYYQEYRKKAFNALRSGNINVLVVNNVLARSMDISDLDNVMIVDLLNDFKTFIYRVGRIGRIKEDDVTTLYGPKEDYILANDNRDALFSGVGILTCFFGRARKTFSDLSSSSITSRPPNNGILCYVLQTGFSTSQDSSLRTILFGVKIVAANNLETVVPLELLLEFSLALNNSLVALQKLGIFCTEPLKISFVGKIEVCCFDKAGNFTADNLVVDDNVTLRVLSSCHSLIIFDKELASDSLKKAALNWVDWNIVKNDLVSPCSGKVPAIRIFQRYHFSSQLKRIIVVAEYTPPGSEPIMITAVKDAPEVLESMFSSVLRDTNHYSKRLPCITLWLF